ncbi:MAG: PD40 domain-containing protein, partial [Gemmatimonadetes bacterium]|nr:PD40 domain-containing protein [Gemmatimonadota bacterium]
MGSRAGRVLLRMIVLLATLVVPAASAKAQPAAYRHYRTMQTAHFRVVVARGLEREGSVAAAVAESAYAKLSASLAAPRGRIDLLVSDDADYSNGYALVSPTSRIVVFATPPIEHAGLRLNEGWLQLVVTHELTHIFHLDRTRGIWRVVQGVFGRAPYFFPNAFSPSWLTEGLAVHEESRLTSGGRLNDALHRMYARAGASGGDLFRLDELSLGTSRFPEGEAAYGYGSLFVDWLAHTHGEPSIERFIDAQAAQVVPYWLDPAARSAFGMSFGRAYTLWSDSVRRSVAARREPLPGWRELTVHGFFATAPRWLNDTTLVYTGGDGRETNAAYLVTTSGRRTRLGRRNSRSASVPMPVGGFLFAQIDFTEPDVIRSDLYVQRGGEVTRLTRGARLIQPDVRGDGEIVAVQLGPARSTLVRVDARTHAISPLTLGAADDIYAEPRWSPDGRRIAVAHQSAGGRFAIEVWDLALNARVTLAEASYLLTSPSWTPDGNAVVYVSEKSGVPAVAITTVAGPSGESETRSVAPSQSGLATPELSRDGRWIAAVELRADGYHLGIAPTATLATTNERVVLHAETLATEVRPARADSFSRYSPWASLVPRYWYPIIESAPWRGTRLGAITTGSDIAGRHAYSAYAAIPTTGRFPIAGVAYRYAGLRRPLYDFAASQNVEMQGELSSAASHQAVGALLKRTRDVSLGQTYLYPHVRSGASVSTGLGVEWRDYLTDPGELLPRLDSAFQRSYTFPRLFVGAGWSNV